ncbi:redoxin domain-containing protein [Sulfurimonas sp. SAG-AH-194-I05]|nr:redoxin domain-containing protein [Sulfurimonas sp. SAG-AH-194-I05]MDF1874613.1 redoxin domain-containing protein [Sulfurimonas sp. SAG-AH-194-I05]
MVKKLKYYVKEIILFIVIITIFANALSLYKSHGLNNADLSLADIYLTNNENYSLKNDRPTLVHIWAIWCPTCKVEASNIQTLSKSYEVLTIAVKSGSNSDINNWLKANGYDYNVVNDQTGFISANFKVAVFPTTLIYDKNKKLVFSDVGYTSTWGLFLRMWWASL